MMKDTSGGTQELWRIMNINLYKPLSYWQWVWHQIHQNYFLKLKRLQHI